MGSGERCFFLFFFFFKQKTAYEIVDCDWSSDVCSSDLTGYIGLLGSVMLMTDSEPVTLVVLSAMTLVSGAIAKALEPQLSEGNPDDPGVIISTAVSCGMVS